MIRSPILLLLLAGLFQLGCSSERTVLSEKVHDAAPATRPASSPTMGDAPLFRDVASEVGLDFQHFTGATGKFYMPEIMGAGVALPDYDGDGDLDIYLVQGMFLDPGRTFGQALFPPPPNWRPGNRLFRNELIPEGRLRFTDVTEQAGVGHIGYGMGAAVGDYNNDGYPDLYVTNFGHNVLYRNNGNGTFTDVTKQAGVDVGRWSTSAAFVDYDGDGLLDLFVANYVDFNLKANPRCTGVGGERDYCGPQVFRPTPSRLFRNLGNGRFADVTERAGITAAFGAGLGVSCADFNGDGRPDIFVANDRNANQLWLNQGNGVFQDQALIAGTAYNADGKAQAGMGVTAGDFDNDGDEDVFVTNMVGEANMLYLNDGKGFFHDATMQYGLAAPSLPFTGFGTEWFDYDNDGFLDLFVANGAVAVVDSLRGTRYPYHQRNRIFHNLAGRKFVDVSESAGPALLLSEVGRGAAFGDIDNDGRIDIVVANNNGPVRLLLNQTGSKQHYLQIRLEGVNTNRSGLGARVAVLRHGQRPMAPRPCRWQLPERKRFSRSLWVGRKCCNRRRCGALECGNSRGLEKYPA